MNNIGVITLGIPGGPCVCIGFDTDKGKSTLFYRKTRPDVEFMVAEAALRRVCIGRIPGSHRTSRLRKKRRKAVMAVVPLLEKRGLIKPTKCFGHFDLKCEGE